MHINDPERMASGPHRVVPAGHYRTVLTILLLGGIIYTVCQAILLPTLGVLADGLHTSTTAATWILTVYILSGGVATPIIGRLGDMYGKKRALVVMLATVNLGLVLSAVAGALPLMLLGRALAGISSGIFPLSYGLIRDEFPSERVASALGIISVSIGVGTGFGVLIAGVIVAHLSYHWLFWIPLMVAAPTCLAAWWWIPESPLRTGGTVDWAGAGLLVAGLVSVLLGISEATTWGWGSPKTLLLLAGGMALLLVWIAFELRLREPLINMRTMALPGVWRTNAVAALSGFSMFAAFAVIPRFVQEPSSSGYGFNASISGAGLYLVPATLTMALLGPLAGPIERRVGSKAALGLGCAFSAAGFVVIAVTPTARLDIYAGTALVGVGLGLAYAAMPNLIMRAVPQEQTGAAGGINTIVRAVGGAVGVQICTTLIDQNLVHSAVPSMSGYTVSFWLMAAALIIATAVSLIIPTQRSLARARALTTPPAANGAQYAGPASRSP